MNISILALVGVVATMALIVGVGVYSGTKVKSNKDFVTGGGKAGALTVCGGIMGSLVSGQATLGTAQMAYVYGMSAWWFTLGAGLGCLFLALFYVKPLRKTGKSTLMEVISSEYGNKAEVMGSALSSIGLIISIIAQMVASCALLTSIFNMSVEVATIITILLMVVYVTFGGAIGAGLSGVVKVFLLYGVCILSMIFAIAFSGGVFGLIEDVRTVVGAEAFRDTFCHMFGRGAAKDLGATLSLILGVISTQTYAQAIWTGSSDRVARKGAMLSALLMPPIGIAGIVVGLFMRGESITADELEALRIAGEHIPEGVLVLSSSAQAFPAFFVNYMPDLLGGIALGTMVITIVGGGAGLSLGASIVIVRDILTPMSKKIANMTGRLTLARGIILLILIGSGITGILIHGTVINELGFLSMGLRGAVIVVPLTCALFLSGKIEKKAVFLSIVLGPLGVILGKLYDVPMDPIFIGIAINVLCVILGRKKSCK